MTMKRPVKPTTPQNEISLLARHVANTAMQVADEIAKLFGDAARLHGSVNIRLGPEVAAMVIEYMAAIDAYRSAMNP